MNATSIRHGAVVVLVLLGAACGSSGPASPTGPGPIAASPPPTPNVPPEPPAPIDFPPLSGPSRTFVFERELDNPVRDFTRQSRIVLYDNGAFDLRYPPSQSGSGSFPGAFQVADGVLMFLFQFQGRSVGSRWDDATGTLEGDSLTVRYHEQMHHADFEDAVYVLRSEP